MGCLTFLYVSLLSEDESESREDEDEDEDSSLVPESDSEPDSPLSESDDDSSSGCSVFCDLSATVSQFSAIVVKGAFVSRSSGLAN